MASLPSSQKVNHNQNYTFLVKVENDRLMLLPEALKNLIEKLGENSKLPVAVISVIGQPKSVLPSRLILRLKYEFERQADKCLTPFGHPDKFPYFPDLSQVSGIQQRDQSGILICTKPLVIRPSRGVGFVALFLDFWDKTTTSAEYEKLVDFCFSVSSVIILTEISNTPSGFLTKISKSDENQTEEEGKPHQLLVSVTMDKNYEQEKIQLKGFFAKKYLLKSESGSSSSASHLPQLRRIIETVQSLNPNSESWNFHTVPEKMSKVSDPDYATELHKFVFQTLSDTINIFKQAPKEKCCPVPSLYNVFSQLIEIINNGETTNTHESYENNGNNSEHKGTKDELETKMTQIDNSSSNNKTGPSGTRELPNDCKNNTDLKLAENHTKTTELNPTETATSEGIFNEKNSNSTDEEESINKSFVGAISLQKEEEVEKQDAPNSVGHEDQSIDLRTNDTDKFEFIKEFRSESDEKKNTERTDAYIVENDRNKSGKVGKVNEPSRKYRSSTSAVGRSRKISSSTDDNVGNKNEEQQASHTFHDGQDSQQQQEYSSKSEQTGVQRESTDQNSGKNENKFQNQTEREKLPQAVEPIKNQIYNTLPADKKQNIESKVQQEQLVKRFVDAYNNTLIEYLKSNESKLYIHPNELEAQHASIKKILFEYLNKIPTKLPEEVFHHLEIQFDEIFQDIYVKHEKAYLNEILQNAKTFADSKLNEEIEKLEQRVRKDPVKFEIDTEIQQQELNNYWMYFIKNLDGKWESDFTDWFSSQTNEYICDLKEMQKQKNSYLENLKVNWSKFACIETNQIEKLHEICLKNLEIDKSTYNWNYCKIGNLTLLTTELIFNKFEQHNFWIFEALTFAETAYNNFMNSKISTATYTDKQVKILHDIAIKSILQNFDCPPEFVYSYVWMKHREEIQKTLQSKQDDYIKLNQDKLRAERKQQEEIINKCKKIYMENMRKQMQPTKVTNELMDHYHITAKKAAIGALSESERNLKGELITKLTILRQSYDDENGRNPEKENETLRLANKYHDSNESANISEKEPFGVGLFFGPEMVQLGIYKVNSKQHKNLTRLPTIYFPGGDIEFFGEKGYRTDCFNVYELLSETPYVHKKVKACSEKVNLLPEEIVAIFLNKIKSEVENQAKVQIKSCVVATSAFMTTNARRRLKSALFIAGFEKSTLIQSTTAIGLSYVVQTKLNTHQSIALIHHSKLTFDIALAEIKQNSVRIKNITGTPYLEKPDKRNKSYLWSFKSWYDDESDKFKIKLLSSTINTFKNQDSQLAFLVASGSSDQTIKDAIEAQVKKNDPAIKKYYAEGQITFGAAALHASQNSNSTSPLDYTEVFPYTLKAQLSTKDSKTIVTHNAPIIAGNLKREFALPENYHWQKLYIQEENNAVIGEYYMEGDTRAWRKFLYYITLDFEGLLESVECKSADKSKVAPIISTVEFMSRNQEVESRRKLEFLLIPPVIFNAPENGLTVAVNTIADSDPPSKAEAKENGKEEIAEKLKSFIAEVKSKLEKTTTTSSLLQDRCRERIRQAELALENSETKEKALQMEYKKLEICSSKINED